MASLAKLAALFVQPKYWSALMRGVAPTVEHQVPLAGRDFATVIDVGANKGQFAFFASRAWPNADLYCFEPLPKPRARLESLLGSRAVIHPMALGAEPGDAEMHIASRADSSSLLALGELQKSMFGMDESGTQRVRIARLDAVLNATQIKRPALLKIDVQGFEYQTLIGAADILHCLDSIYVECSFVELYRDQHLVYDIVALLEKAEFVETGRFNLQVGEDGMLFQADILFEPSFQNPRQ